jgi:hypothetical protein
VEHALAHIAARKGHHPRRLSEETAWIEGYRQRWASRFDELDNVLEKLTPKEKADGRKIEK